MAVAVVLADVPGADDGAIYRWSREHLAAYQLPRVWYQVKEIPRTARGKVNRAQVAQMCAGLTPLDLRALERSAQAAAVAASRSCRSHRAIMTSAQSLRDELLRNLETWGVGLSGPIDADSQLISSGRLDSVALYSLSVWIEEQTGQVLDPTTVNIASEWDSAERVIALIERARCGSPGAQAGAEHQAGDSACRASRGARGRLSHRTLHERDPRGGHRVAAPSVEQ